MQVAKSPAAPMAAFAYRITEAGMELLAGHAVPAQVQSSVINMQWTYDNITFGHVKLCDTHGIKADVCTP